MINIEWNISIYLIKDIDQNYIILPYIPYIYLYLLTTIYYLIVLKPDVVVFMPAYCDLCAAT